jgi:hypothetical protein
MNAKNELRAKYDIMVTTFRLPMVTFALGHFRKKPFCVAEKQMSDICIQVCSEMAAQCRRNNGTMPTEF